MIEVSGDTLHLAGVVNNDRAGALLEEGEEAVVRTSVIDLSGVTAADSSTVAMLIAWVRAARRQGRDVRIANAPLGLRNLAELYGVREFLPFVA